MSKEMWWFGIIWLGYAIVMSVLFQFVSRDEAKNIKPEEVPVFVLVCFVVAFFVWLFSAPLVTKQW